MSNNHLITRQVFELRVGFNDPKVPQLQNAFSQHYWQTAVPAFEKLFERLVGPDELVRVDHLELDVGRWSSDDIISGHFIDELIVRLESVITDTLQGNKVNKLPIRMGHFQLWLHFLEHGYLPVTNIPPESQEVWQQHIIDSLASGLDAERELRHLVLKRPVALERLVRQHDKLFLQKLLNTLSGQSQSDLFRLADEAVSVITKIIRGFTRDCVPKKGKAYDLVWIATTMSERLAGLLTPPLDKNLKERLNTRVINVLGRYFSNPQGLAEGLLQQATWAAILEGFVSVDSGAALAKKITGALQQNIQLKQLANQTSSEFSIPEKESSRRHTEFILEAIMSLANSRVRNRESIATPEAIAGVLSDVLADSLTVPVNSDLEENLKKRIVEVLDRHFSSPQSLAQGMLQASTWEAILDGFVTVDTVSVLASQISKALEDNLQLQQLTTQFQQKPVVSGIKLDRQIEFAVWHEICDEILTEKHHSSAVNLIARVVRSDALLPWQGSLIKVFDKKIQQNEEDLLWKQVAKAIYLLPPLQTSSKGQHQMPMPIDQATQIPDVSAEEPRSIIEEGEVFYVSSAGVVLLHPFLSRFFENLKLCKAGSFIDESCRQRAVCLIQHLATRDVVAPEYLLVLAKFLCGMPFNVPIDHSIEISSQEEAEAEGLMLAAIKNWGALGQSSPDWLREVFFQRDGKLEKRETGWSLRVERKAQDVLLDQLPHGWGLGIVKLPWMDEILRIDW